MTLRTVLLSLQALLAAAEPDDPQDAVVANQVRTPQKQGWVEGQSDCPPPLNITTYNDLLQGDLLSRRCICMCAQYKQDCEMFKQTARLWAHVYAGAPASNAEYTRKIDKLCAMGFDKVRWLHSLPTP